jgi:acyl-CoA synthetase (AMP-forming)/AMP-acid ligase II
VGDELGQERAERLYQVRRFWEKLSLSQVRVLWRQGYVWNTMVLVGRAGLLVTLFALLTPTLVGAFQPLRRVLGTPRESDVLTAGEIRAYCHEHLAPYKVPAIVVLRRALPKTLLGSKVLRRMFGDAPAGQHAVESDDAQEST